jgi:hypothetical protein
VFVIEGDDVFLDEETTRFLETYLSVQLLCV